MLLTRFDIVKRWKQQLKEMYAFKTFISAKR